MTKNYTVKDFCNMLSTEAKIRLVMGEYARDFHSEEAMDMMAFGDFVVDRFGIYDEEMSGEKNALLVELVLATAPLKATA